MRAIILLLIAACLPAAALAEGAGPAPVALAVQGGGAEPGAEEGAEEGADGTLAAEEGPAPAGDPPAPAEGEAAAAEAPAEGGFAPLDAREVRLADFLWVARPVVVFADSPADPLFARQMRYLEAGWPDLAARDVVVIVDTDPAARSDARQRLRPRGFSLVFVDKDGDVKQRKPQPWTARELVHAIDRTPLRRQEMLEQSPAGR